MTSFTEQITARNDQQLSLEDAIAIVHSNAHQEWKDEADQVVRSLCQTRQFFTAEECSCQGEKEACNLCPPNAFEKNIQTLERCLEALSSVAHESLELAKELHKRADDDSRKLSL